MSELFQFILLLMLAASVMLHFCAVFLSLRLMRMSRKTLPWAMISAALTLMAAERAVFFYRLTGGSAEAPKLSAEVFAFLVPLLLVTGLLLIAPLVRRIGQMPDSRDGKTNGDPSDELFEKAKDGMAVCEAVDKGSDFIVQDINPAAERIGKTVRQHVRGRRLKEAFPDMATAGLANLLQRVWKTGKAEQALLCCRSKDGAVWRDVYVCRRSGGDLVAVYSDASGRIGLQQEADRCRKESGLLFEQTPLACQRMAPGGVILAVNPAWVRLTGISEDAASGRFFGELLSRASRNEFQNLPGGLEPGSPPAEITLELRRSDGGYLSVEAALFPLCADGDSIAQIFCVLRSGRGFGPDESVESEKSLSKALEKVSAERRELELRHLSLFGELAGGIARELNTPLAAARNAFNLMRQGSDPTGPQYEFTGIASRELTRMEELIEQMCLFHDPVVCDSERLNINAMLDNVLTLLKSSVQKQQIQVCDERAPSIPPVVLPPGAVMSILLHPVRNSLEAMGSGGVLTLRTGPAEQGGVLVEIEDNGPGIPGEFLPRLFEPFTTCRLQNRTGNGGVGLGMAIVLHLLNSLGGSIQVQSGESSGTCVRITFPPRILPAEK